MAKAMRLVSAVDESCNKVSSVPFAEAVADLEAALRVAMAPKAQWQPIETAPKDGTDILLAIIDAEHSYIDHVERGYFEVVAEDEEDGPWDIRDGEPWCSYEGDQRGFTGATHAARMISTVAASGF